MNDSRPVGRSCSWRRRLAVQPFAVATTICWLLAFAFSKLAAGGEFDTNEPPLLATSAQLLMMEQIDELVATGERAEAILNLEKLFDQAGERIVPEGGVQQAATLKTQRYIPLQRWTQNRLKQLLREQPDSRRDYQTKVADNARAKLSELQASKDIVDAQKAALRYLASTSGPELNLLLSDLHLERGWSLAAVQAAEFASSDLRVLVSPDDEQSGTFSWPLTWRNVDGQQPREQQLLAFRTLLAGDSLSGRPKQELLVEALRRLILSAAVSPELVDQPATLRWADFVAESLDAENRNALTRLIDDSRSWPALTTDVDSWLTFAGDDSRNRVLQQDLQTTRSFSWSQMLDRYYAFNDRTPASQPRVGESDKGTLPYYPVVSSGKVYLNAHTRLVAYDLDSGRPWPDLRPPLPMFDSQLASATYVPQGYPLVGTPRATLTVTENCLYARMGKAVTGWTSSNGTTDEGSSSYLIGLDLERQGSVLSGFPLRLFAPEFPDAEFDGPPLVWGELLIVAIAQRDNVGLNRSAAAFNRFSGELIWHSKAIAAGTVEASDRANIISHQLFSSAGGRLYYNTNLGSIVCLDPLTGRIEWLTRYARKSTHDRAFVTSDRFRYRDLTPCLIHRGLVYCAPQDCPEIFVLDATTGDLVWSTDDEQVSDAIHLLGIHEDCLLVSGDRLVWLDRLSGRVISSFPGSSTPGMLNALPSPRGLGRGVITGGKVYWPTSGEIFVFPASLEPPAKDAAVRFVPPPILRRVELDARANDGGNLIVAGDWLLYCTPNRLLAFQWFQPKPAKPVSRISE